jgi:hypothetical protein
MKKFLLGLLALVSVAAYGTLPETDKAILMSSNIVNNPGFESGTAGWTASGGTFTADATAKGLGGLGGNWNSSAAAQTLRSKLMPIPNGFKGKNAVVSCAIKTVSGASTHKLQAFDGTNVVAEVPSTYSTTSFARTTINFVAPSSGSIAVQLTSVAADEPAIYVDDCTISLADGFNLSQINQASLVGTLTYAAATNCQWNTTSSSYATFAADTDCSTPTVTGIISAPATKVPGFVISNLSPGHYLIMAKGAFAKTGGASEVITGFRMTDGTTTFGEQGQTGGASSSMGFPNWQSGYEATTAQSNVNFTFQAKTSGNTASIAADSSSGYPGLEFEIYRFPTESETAYRADLGPSSWSGYHGSDCQWSRASASFGNMTADASCTFTESSNANFGVVTSALVTDKIPGIVFTPQRAGQYFVCATTPTYNSTADYTGTRLTDGTNVLVAQNKYFANTSSVTVPVAHCGILNVTSTAQVTLRLEGFANTGTLQMGANADTLTHSVDWSIFSMTQSFPAPTLIGSVTSQSAGAERIERVEFGGASNPSSCTSTPCTIYSQSGSWISSVSRGGSGDYTLNIAAGIFSGVPVCTARSHTATSMVSSNGNTKTSTSIGLLSRNQESNTSVDTAMDIICMGPK